MIKQYGEDGYIFLGRGYLASSIQSTSILPVYTAYDRNLQRALDLLDLFDVVGLGVVDTYRSQRTMAATVTTARKFLAVFS